MILTIIILSYGFIQVSLNLKQKSHIFIRSKKSFIEYTGDFVGTDHSSIPFQLDQLVK